MHNFCPLFEQRNFIFWVFGLSWRAAHKESLSCSHIGTLSYVSAGSSNLTKRPTWNKATGDQAWRKGLARSANEHNTVVIDVFQKGGTAKVV